jgi:uncharacterized Zn finger protein (UPF0148 family)
MSVRNAIFQENFMAEGYCVKCKAKKEIAEAFEEVMKNGRKAIKGKCPTCGVVMFKILGGKASSPAAPTKSETPAATPAASTGTTS